MNNLIYIIVYNLIYIMLDSYTYIIIIINTFIYNSNFIFKLYINMYKTTIQYII